MKFWELMKSREGRWLNLFIRDFLLVGCLVYLQFATHFNSKSVFMITGMMIVWFTWQLSDYLNEQRRL